MTLLEFADRKRKFLVQNNGISLIFIRENSAIYEVSIIFKDNDATLAILT